MRLSMLIAALLLAASAWSLVSGSSKLKFAEASQAAEPAPASK